MFYIRSPNACIPTTFYSIASNALSRSRPAVHLSTGSCRDKQNKDYATDEGSVYPKVSAWKRNAQ